MASETERPATIVVSEGERAWLVRLCSRLVGDRTIAEDLAQDTLLEAWRVTERQPSHTPRRAWLAGIARNVCLRWRHSQGRRWRRESTPPHYSSEAAEQTWSDVADDTDIAMLLEQEELATLLERALGGLPGQVREILLAHHLAEVPLAEIAARSGLSEKAVSMRLVRARKQLQQVLARDASAEMARLGLGAHSSGAWQESTIWCPLCGQRRLLCRFDRSPDRGGFALCCPGCGPTGARRPISSATFDDLPELGAILASGSGTKVAFNRLLGWGAAYYQGAIADGTAPCPRCGRQITLRHGPPEHWALDTIPPLTMVHLHCPHCGISPNTALHSLVLARSETRRFWREQGRIRVLPTYVQDFSGRPGMVTGFESVVSMARLEVVFDARTFEPIHINARR